MTTSAPSEAAKTAYRPRGGTFAWTGLRGIGNSWAAKASILVPFVGYFLLFNKEIVDYLQIHHSFCLNNCEASWRIFFIYYAFCAASAGSLVYTLLCPQIVKSYKTSRQFFQEDRLFYTHPNNLGWMLDDVNKMRPTKYCDGMDYKYYLRTGEAVPAERAYILSGLMAEFFNLSNHKFQIARLITFVLYMISFALFLYPTAVTFRDVSMIAYSSYYSAVDTFQTSTSNRTK